MSRKLAESNIRSRFIARTDADLELMLDGAKLLRQEASINEITFELKARGYKKSQIKALVNA